MFVVEVGSVFTTLLAARAVAGHGEAGAGFVSAIAAWLWFTVLFANFAEAMAEGRGKAQAAETLRKPRKDVPAKTLRPPLAGRRFEAEATRSASELRVG